MPWLLIALGIGGGYLLLKKKKVSAAPSTVTPTPLPSPKVLQVGDRVVSTNVVGALGTIIDMSAFNTGYLKVRWDDGHEDDLTVQSIAPFYGGK